MQTRYCSWIRSPPTRACTQRNRPSLSLKVQSSICRRLHHAPPSFDLSAIGLDDSQMPVKWLLKGSLLITSNMTSPVGSTASQHLSPQSNRLMEESELPPSSPSLQPERGSNVLSRLLETAHPMALDEVVFGSTSNLAPLQGVSDPGDTALLRQLSEAPFRHPSLPASRCTSSDLTPDATSPPTSHSGSASLQQPARTSSEDLVHSKLSEDGSTRIVKEERSQSSPASADDSDSPIGAVRKRRRAKISPSCSSGLDPDTELPETQPSSSRTDIGTNFDTGTEDEQDRMPGPSKLLIIRSKEAKGLDPDDIQWLDPCDTCVKNRIKCYTSPGKRTQACFNCNFLHWECLIDGQSVCRRPPPTAKYKERKPAAADAPKSQIKAPPNSPTPPASTTESVPTDEHVEDTVGIRRTKSGRFSRAVAQTPITLTGNAKPSFIPERRRRDHLKRKGRQTQGKPTANSPSDSSSPPQSDQECLPNADAADRSSIGPSSQPKSTSQDCSRSARESPQVRFTTQQAANADDERENCRGTAIMLSGNPTADSSGIGSVPAPNPRLRIYTTGLIKDIVAGIRRCQDRLTGAAEHAALLFLESVVGLLVEDLAKVLTTKNKALDGSQPSDWILPELKGYLQRVLLECQRVRETPGGKELDPAEKGARQLAAIMTSETLFDRCLTLISTTVGENST